MEDEVNRLLQQLKSTHSATERVSLIGQLFELNVSNRQIHKATRIPDYQIRHYLRVYQKLTPDVMKLFRTGKISFSLTRAIASLTPSKQERAARDAIAKRMSVNEFRQKMKGNNDRQLTAELERLSDRYSALSGLDISIRADKHNPKAGVWVIRYTDLDMFDVIADVLLQGKQRDEF